MLPPPAIAAHLPDAVRAAQRLAWAREATGEPGLALERASTDAGFRSYWRAATAAGARIVMDSPPGLEDAGRWLRLHALLAAHGVRVPAVLARDEAAGFLLLEDLGARTALQALDDLDADALMDAAFAELLRLQAIPPPAWLPDYDAALVERDLGLFHDWFLVRHLGVALDAGEAAAWRALRERVLAATLAQPRVLVHRDYILRNLMPVDGGVAVLDFQDAVRGPIAYDPASLLRDAFHTWPAPRADAWLRGYHARAREAGLPVPGLERFRHDAALMGAQRHLKILGIFARLHHRDGKPHYLHDAPRFLGYLDEALPGLPELAPLAGLLDRHVRPRLAL
nr:phosphotransferase [Luteimonas sp. Y-2-2-4F]